MIVDKRKKPSVKIIVFGTIGLVLALFIITRKVWGVALEYYFESRCDTSAGEFITETVENVQGVYQMRLRDPRELFSRLRVGDPPEDLFGHTNVEAARPWKLFLVSGLQHTRYKFFETMKPPNERRQTLNNLRFENDIVSTGDKYWRYERAHSNAADAKFNNIAVFQVSSLESKYGFTWREVQSEWDKVFGVRGGELVIVNLESGEEIAIRRGFYYSSKLAGQGGICPRDKTPEITGTFIRKVLKPSVVED